MDRSAINWIPDRQDGDQSEDDGKVDESRAIAMLQAWLWFGLLDAFFEDFESVDPNAFLSQKVEGGDYSGTIVNTSALPSLFSRWHPWVLSLSDEKRKNYASQIRNVLKTVGHYSLVHFASSTNPLSRCPLSQEVQLSVCILGETLAHAICFVIDNLRDRERFGAPKLVRQRLRDGFWCPIDMTLNDTTVAYFATMMRPRAYKSRTNHEQRTGKVCSEASVPTQGYQTRHVTEDCICPHVFAPADLYSRAIDERDQMPCFASLSAKLADPVYRKVREKECRIDPQSLGYTAISHVWADGLGNPSANSLPTCQVSALQDRVNSLYDLGGQNDICVSFFLDTLCIPVAEPSGEEGDYRCAVRKKAISMMNRVYSEASRVLVLDQDISGLCTTKTDTLELLVRLSTSRWAHRLWTLQEAALSKVIFLQLRDAAVRIADLMDDIWKRLDDRPTWDVLTFLVSLWAENLSSLRSSIDKSGTADSSSETRVINAFLCASERSTSRKEDEVAVLALLAGLDIREMRVLLNRVDSAASGQNESTRRSSEFLNILQKIPKHLLLTPGPRCQQNGRRACPVDLLEAWRATTGGPGFSDFHQVVSAGVLGTWAGLRIRSGLPDQDHFDIRTWTTEMGIFFPLKDSRSGEWQTVSPTNAQAPMGDPKDLVRAVAGRDLFVLFDDCGPAISGRIVAAMLVAAEQNSNSNANDSRVIKAHWLSFCILHSVDESQRPVWEFGSRQKLRDYPVGVPVNKDQVWCID